MKSKWLIGTLIASLALNIAAVGFVAGYVGSTKAGTRGIDPTAGLARLVRMLPEERRRELAVQGASVLAESDQRRQLRRSLGELRGAQRIIARAVSHEPFDQQRLAEALAGYREHFAANQAGNHQALVDILARLTPEERRRFLQTMRAMPRGHERPRPRHRAEDREDEGTRR